jgi:hypothetical protein
MNPFGAFALGSLFFGLVMGLPFLFLGAAAAYLALRSRDAGSDVQDPELGTKTSYCFLFTLGIILVHIGLTVNLFDLIDSDRQPAPQPNFGFGQPQPVRGDADGPFLTATMRTGWAMVLSGLVTAVLMLTLLKLGTNDRRFPAARRVFVGFRVILLGTVVLIAFTTLVVVLFQKETPTGGTFEAALATLAVCTPSLAIHVFLLRLYSRLPYHNDPKGPPKRRRYADDEDDDD